VELNAYQRQVFIDFREAEDVQGRFAQLAELLNGRGVPNVGEALDQLLLQPILQPFGAVAGPGHLRWLLNTPPEEADLNLLLDATEEKLIVLLEAARNYTGGNGNPMAIAAELRAELSMLLGAHSPGLMPVTSPLTTVELAHSASPVEPPTAVDTAERIPNEPVDVRTPVVEHDDVLFHLPDDIGARAASLAWVCVHALGKVNSEPGFEQRSRSWIDEWKLGKVIVDALREMGQDDAGAAQLLALVKWMTSHQRWYAEPAAVGNHPRAVLEALLSDPDVQQFLHINRYRDVLWFNKESFDQLLDWLMLLAHLGRGNNPAAINALRYDHLLIERLRMAEAASGFQVDRLLTNAALSPV
jgi:hypothetical protein